MPTDEAAVVPSVLLTHAVEIESVAAQIGQAKQAADTVRVDNEAYGKLCWTVPIMINSLQDIVLEAIGAADDSLRDTAQRLRETADSYVAADSAIAETIRGAGPVP